VHLVHAELLEELRSAGFRVQPGEMSAVLERATDGELIRKAGVMGIVATSGQVGTGDPIAVELPALPHEPLRVV
jgi:MOSC domain-containing protein YiiM